MGTHPIFESDFDCLTDLKRATVKAQREFRAANQTTTQRMSYQTSAPPTNPNAFKPAANVDDQLIKPKKVPNPIKESNLHSALNRELKIKSKSGSVFPQKSELEKAFHNRRIGAIQTNAAANQINQADERSEIEIELTQRLECQKAKLEPKSCPAEEAENANENDKPVEHEFMRVKLRKTSS